MFLCFCKNTAALIIIKSIERLGEHIGMDGGLLNGFHNALSLLNILYCFIGCLLGTLIGVLPALGPAATIAILLPLTVRLPFTGAIIMMAGIFYGAMYGGSTTSILINVPGESAAAATCLDGFPMTKQGRAGEALSISAIGSFIAGTAGVILLSFVAPTLAEMALRFSSPEYFGLVLFSLTIILSLSESNILKGVICGFVGMTLACAGLDPLSGRARLGFGMPKLLMGLEVIPIMVGLFGLAEVLSSTEEKITSIYEGRLGRLIPRGQELKKGIFASLRGTASGLVLGLLPGMMPSMTTWIAYDIEKRISKHPERFGTGCIEGVAAPEAANNATAQGGFIPLIALGIPTCPIFAMLLAALMMYGIPPGPLLFTQYGDFAWTFIASMYIGNVILLILNLPLVAVWARICLIPYWILSPVILGVCFVGTYSLRNSMFDIWVCLFFGVAGYAMKRWNWPVAPLVLGFILGPMFEEHLRASLQMSGGSPTIFFTRPIATVFIGLAFASILIIIIRKLWSRSGAT